MGVVSKNDPFKSSVKSYCIGDVTNLNQFDKNGKNKLKNTNLRWKSISLGSVP